LHKGTNLTSVDPESGEIVELFNPRLSHWEEHFDLIGAEVIGISATGRTRSDFQAI
jgi:hypothetical protein